MNQEKQTIKNDFFCKVPLFLLLIILLFINQKKQQKKSHKQKEQIKKRMIQIVEDRSEGVQSQQYGFDGIQQRIWEEVANQYRQEIQQLQLQLWQQNIDKVFQKSNGVPKKLQSKLKMMKMGKSKKQCSICCNEFVKDEVIIQLPCKHIFHQQCVSSWLEHSTKCPNCRSDVLEALRSQI